MSSAAARKNLSMSLSALGICALAACAFAADSEPRTTIKDALAKGEVTRRVVTLHKRATQENPVAIRRNGQAISDDEAFGLFELRNTSGTAEARKQDTTIVRSLRSTERMTGVTRFNKGGTATYTDFVIPLEWFYPTSAYPDYTEPLFVEYTNGAGQLTGLGMYSDGNYQFGYWGSSFVELADSISGVAGNADLELIMEIEGYDQIGSPYNNIKYYPALRTRMNVYGFSNATLNAAGPSTLSASRDLALPYDGEVMVKRDLQTAHTYNDCYVSFGSGPLVYTDDIFTVSFDFLDFDPNSDKYIEYILRSATVRAYWYE